jgi:chromosome segregation ATPase
MNTLVIVSVAVVVLILMTIVVWNVTGRNVASKLESIICKVGRSYEEVGTSKDVRITELQVAASDCVRMRTELAEKQTVIAHLEIRISGYIKDTEHGHENYTKRVLEMEHLNECLQTRDEELAKYRPEVARLEALLRHVTKENETMGRKLAIVNAYRHGTKNSQNIDQR